MVTISPLHVIVLVGNELKTKYDLNYHSLLKYNVKMMKMYNILKDKYIKH